jgi:uncharacterized membrane protein
MSDDLSMVTFSLLLCISDCGQPTTENGIATLLDSSNSTYMTLANVTCNEGYETNISHVECQSDATWSAGNCSKISMTVFFVFQLIE